MSCVRLPLQKCSVLGGNRSSSLCEASKYSYRKRKKKMFGRCCVYACFTNTSMFQAQQNTHACTHRHRHNSRKKHAFPRQNTVKLSLSFSATANYTLLLLRLAVKKHRKPNDRTQLYINHCIFYSALAVDSCLSVIFFSPYLKN